MYTVSCDKQAEEEDLQGSKGDVGCDEEGGRGAGGEDTLPEVGYEGAHRYDRDWCGRSVGLVLVGVRTRTSRAGI